MRSLDHSDQVKENSGVMAEETEASVGAAFAEPSEVDLAGIWEYGLVSLRLYHCMCLSWDPLDPSLVVC